MGIYGTVLTRQIDINVLESLCLKKFAQKIEINSHGCEEGGALTPIF